MKKLNENIERFAGKSLEIISFYKRDGEIGINFNLKASIPQLIQDVFVITDYQDCIEYHVDEKYEELYIEIVKVNDHNQVEECIICGNKQQIQSILVANGEATPNNPIDFKSVNFPEEMRMAVSTFEMMLQDLQEKQNELA
tara:strand:- start:343 stop:765 length:423 start_codon:yes stop_codon:yes gene_type:complete